MTAQWWRDAVVYQVYPRSFVDSDGDGEGDLAGVTARLDHLVELGVDALWLSPFYPSPMVDGGYDIADHTAVDPRYGTLADLDDLLGAAHARGLRVTVDLVPNHCSSEHPWFTAAVAAGRGSRERARFLFRDGRGPDGAVPPTNWRSVFGGPSWTRVPEPDGSPGQWYYHLFAAEQPDLDHSHPDVAAELERTVRFWLDRGVDGFRIDVSDALIKDFAAGDTPDGHPVIPKDDASGVHEIYRALRRVLDSYDGERMAVIETGAEPEVVALFLRPDEMHLAFSFDFARAPWTPAALRDAIDDAVATTRVVGAPATWVTDNHDTPRSVTRYARSSELTGAYVPTVTAQGPLTAEALARGNARARTAALLMLSLPGAAYLYQGQELGLPEVEDLPAEALQDPAVARSGGTAGGRDGCRVPLPWSGDAPPYGFSPPGGAATWLPQPTGWGPLTVEHQRSDPSSMLALYRELLALRRREGALRAGSVHWLPAPEGVLAYRREAPGARPVVVVANLSDVAVPLPPGEILATTAPLTGDRLAPEAAAVVRPLEEPEEEPDPEGDAVVAGADQRPLERTLVARLRAAGCVFAPDEAALLLELPEPAREAAVVRRVAGEPLEHVLGWVELDGVRLAVAPGVFVPRRRTLLLVDRAAALTPTGSTVLDLCCGNGALGRLLAERVAGLRVHACDVDPVAVALAAQNLAPVGGTATAGDLYDAVPPALRGRIATITANVPYVPSEAEGLMPRDVRLAEPRATRDGGADGLDVLRRVAAGAPTWLAPGGVLLSEVAERQVRAALAVLTGAGLTAEHAGDGEGTAVVIGRRCQG